LVWRSRGGPRRVPALPRPLPALRQRLSPGSGGVRQNPFSSKATGWLIGVAVVSFLVAVGFVIFGAPPPAPPSRERDSFSHSAIGHHAFVRLLRKLEIPVVVSHYDSGARAGASAVLIVAEPSSYHVSELRSMVAAAEHALVVLPKWREIPPELNK